MGSLLSGRFTALLFLLTASLAINCVVDVPALDPVEKAQAHTVSNFKVTQTWPGPLWAFECQNANGTVTITKECTAAQYQMIVGHGGANGAHVTLVDGDPTKPPGQDGSDGDTKDTAPHMEQVAVSNGPGGNVTVVLANQ